LPASFPGIVCALLDDVPSVALRLVKPFSPACADSIINSEMLFFLFTVV
jgi:hypothetical protein